MYPHSSSASLSEGVAELVLVRRDRINSGITNEISPRYVVAGAMIASPNMGPSHSTPSLLGTWRLVSFKARDSKGQLQYPLGEHVSGLLMYDAGGNMSAHVLRNDRPRFAANDPDRGTDAEVRTAFEGYASYFGTYTIDLATQTVTHHVRGAWYPNWMGNDQLRHFKFDGSRLVLSTPPLVSDGQSLEYVLTWERIL